MKPIIPFCLVVVFLCGCAKDDELLAPDPLFPSQAIFKAPLFIEVFTTTGLLVSNAKVMLGSREGHTDGSGLLYWPDATVGESAYLTVEKEGYFHASRRFYPSPGVARYVRIILLSDSRIAFFNTNDGAVLPIEDKATIHFPQKGYVLDNGDAYDGIVVVSAKVIAADDPDLSFKMPGDLVGMNADGSFGALGSMGMIAVEMNTPAGDKLNFEDGVEATFEMNIPSQLTDLAPLTIPLWYFDELDGVWREEGFATRFEDRYVGQVKHFSFWNCDAWFPTVPWGGAFVYEDGSTASQVKVCITIENLGTANCAYTNTDGLVEGMVAANEPLHLQVYGKCGQEIFTSAMGPYSTEYFYGPVTLSDPTSQSHVTGFAYDCQLNPLIQGYIKITTGQESYYAVPDEHNGRFDATVAGCTQGNITVYAINAVDETYSNVYSSPFLEEVVTDSLVACDNLDEYVIVNIEGFATPIYFDSVDFRTYKDKRIYTSIRATDLGGASLGIQFQGEGTGNYYSVHDSGLLGLIDSIQVRSDDKIYITVEKFGGIGEMVSGRFGGKVRTSEFNYVPEYLMTGSFAVRRE